MGCGTSSYIKDIPKDWQDIFKAMKLRKCEIKKLFNIYNTVDIDRSGSIDVLELLMFLDIERTPFSERIFEAFDKDGTHRIDFYEFVVSVWKFCALGNEATSVFAFDLYDKNADGKLTIAEVEVMFKELLGSKAMDHDNVQRELKKLTAEAEYGKVNADSFRRFANIHQALLFNVFGIQNKLRITTLGVALWTKMSRRRVFIRPGCVVKLSDLIILHSHRKMFNEMKQDQDPMKRLSSMMQIVLENTDNAIHKPTPPPSPKRPLKHTKLLNPFAAFTTTASNRKKVINPFSTTTNTATGSAVPVATSEPGRYFPSPPGSPPDYTSTTGTRRKRNGLGSPTSNTTSPPGSPPAEYNNTRKRMSTGSVCSMNSVGTGSASVNSTNSGTRGSAKPTNNNNTNNSSLNSNKVYVTNEKSDHSTTTTTNSNPLPKLSTGRTKEAPRKKSTHLVLIHPEKDLLTS